jgi:hypothetical protein
VEAVAVEVSCVEGVAGGKQFLFFDSQMLLCKKLDKRRVARTRERSCPRWFVQNFLRGKRQIFNTGRGTRLGWRLCASGSVSWWCFLLFD